MEELRKIGLTKTFMLILFSLVAGYISMKLINYDTVYQVTRLFPTLACSSDDLRQGMADAWHQVIFLATFIGPMILTFLIGVEILGSKFLNNASSKPL